ncbi:sporulation delaying protein family toxin [Halobacillus locisalis]|uniref:Sporulation delaying protein family toxin n=1 Tax=Halobacillus locisalis TaxID=220753 RepID=A0A838CUS7_9BACI|nr:sporulation delaying protein family toxin [Halobacillus locisalis]MBA2175827.1 sporulation delaying protein family toxin [Halobacillus locisalis]
MKKKSLFSVLVSIAVLVSTITISFNTVFAADGTASYTGKEIFKGVIAGQGPAAKEFSNLWSGEDLERANEKENVKLVNEVVDKMEENNPAYFKKLEKSLHSKDLKKVEKLLTKGSEDFLSTMNTDYAAEVKKGVVDTNCLVLALTMAVVVTHGAAVTFYLEVVAAGPGLDSAESDTSRESLVVDMVEAAN